MEFVGRGTRSWASRSASAVAFLCWICVCLFILSALIMDSENNSSSRPGDANADITSPTKIAKQGGGSGGEGVGSSPPRCSAKCGECTPCRPVHVSVPPGRTPVTTEYYPEAWRCKCGDKLYMP